jgi:hypothetical protein
MKTRATIFAIIFLIPALLVTGLVGVINMILAILTSPFKIYLELKRHYIKNTQIKRDIKKQV